MLQTELFLTPIKINIFILIHNSVSVAYYDPINKSNGKYFQDEHTYFCYDNLVAHHKALQYALNLNTNKILICTDSKSGL